MESGTTEWAVMMNRLERLEKQNRRFKQIGALAFGLVISVVLFVAFQKGTIEANEFVLKDSTGSVRGVWGVVTAVDGTIGSKLALMDGEGKEAATLLNLPGHSRQLMLNGVNGRSRVTLLVSDLSQSAGLALSDGSSVGRRVSILTSESDDSSDEFFVDPRQSHILLQQRPQETSLRLTDNEGVILWKAP